MGDDRKETFENVFRLVGGHGRYQWFCLFICSMQLLIMTWNHLGYIFMGAVPKFWCDVTPLENTSWDLSQLQTLSLPKQDIKMSGDDSSSEYDQCHYYDLDYAQILKESEGKYEIALQLSRQNKRPPGVKKCEKWRYDTSIFQSTIVTEFDLVCGRRYLVASIQALYMIGALTGNLVFGTLNDRLLGRRKTCLYCITLVLVGGVLTTLSTSYWMFVASRFLVAMGTAGSMLANSNWLLEHCDTQIRARSHCIQTSFFGLGYAIMPLYAYIFREWNHLQLAFTITTLTLVTFFWIFPESPRWLASQGRQQEAVLLLEKMAKYNRVSPLPTREELLMFVQRCHPQKQPQRTKSLYSRVTSALKNFGALLRTSNLRGISFVMWPMFILTAFTYYGFAFFSVKLTTHPYLVVTLGALMEVPASVLPIPFLNRWGRRPTAWLCYLVTALAVLSIAAVPASYEATRTVLSMAGKLCIASAFTVMYLVVGEVYPTVVRSTGQATSSLMGRFGSISAPYVADMLTTIYPDLPSVIFGSVALVAAGLSLMIPEMKDVQMKDQVYEYEETPALRRRDFETEDTETL